MSQFLDDVRTTIRRRGLADSTEKTYVSWIKRYILFQQYQSRDEMTRSPCADIERFLNHLAHDLHLSASSVNQSPGALIFLYKIEAHQKAGNHLGEMIARLSLACRFGLTPVADWCVIAGLLPPTSPARGWRVRGRGSERSYSEAHSILSLR